ncbi:CDP-alcohol phosphatidyltransferase [Arenibacter sp. N53]|uniref:CDP-alcohol phosphatidyltransferase family protein n=1 Tax=Arenibacter TaxID=178469 RepID=UPI000CD42F90|nr:MULTISPECIES: CDP-alcohol phosphatidyltransferase family protein [Arenibacter]MCM4153836.1 CDP-alcohol phosphatidyltransferase [Arenibacter sp. N53]
MSKLPEDHKFLDLSDYGRPIARLIANALKTTAVTPIHVTLGFLICGVIAVECMYHGYNWYAAMFFILKSILDAADGELARIKDTPSYTGRYFDSVSDIVLNILIFLVLWRITNTDFGLTLLAFLGLQLQGTLYNYYYVILRNRFQGDVTSRIFESGTPVAMVGEQQRNVNILFWWYKMFYGSFDLIIYKLDAKAANGRRLPNWLMTAVSTFGLGFQLLTISVMLVLGWVDYIVPFFIIYSIFIFLFIAIRRSL